MKRLLLNAKNSADMKISDSVARTLSSQFLFAAVLMVVLHHSREMMHYVAGQSFYALLIPVLFDLSLLGMGLVLALLAVRYFRNARIVQFATGLSLLALILVCAFSLLYESKTGDWLSLQVVIFGVSNADEVAGMIVKEVSIWQWLLVLFACLIVAASLFFAHQISRRFLVGLCGIGLLSIASNGITQDGEADTTYFSRTVQIGWLHGQSTPWHKSMILSMLGQGAGHKSQFDVLQAQQNYLSPEFVSQTGPRPNILFIVLESTRYNVTSPYASAARFNTITPNLQRLASQGIVVDKAYTTVPHTSKALVGIFCGQFPREELNILEAERNGLPFNCLPKIMNRAGYQTAYFQSAIGSYENRPGLVMNMGFDYVRTLEKLQSRDFASVGYFGADDNIMVKPAVEWMKSKRDSSEPFFVGMLTVVSHHPYARPHEEPDISTPDKAYRAYEMSVQSTDVFLGRLVEAMRREGLMKNTLIVITGDHGEGFGEHGPRMHNGTAYEEGMRVPLVLYGPDVLREPGRLGGLRQHLDLMPTVLDMAGIKTDQAQPGKSLLDPEGHEMIAMQCWYQDYCAVGLNRSDEKLIYWYGKRPLESFDLDSDPGEKVNLAEQWGSEERDLKIKEVFQHLANLRSIYN